MIYTQVEVNHGAGDVVVTTASGGKATASRTLGGDVIFCAGQSNMVFPLELAFNATAEAETLSKYPNFRFFMTALDYESEPQFDLKPGPSECVPANASLCAKKCAVPGMCNRWVTAAEASANNYTYLMQFSAVCYLTARDIARMHTGTRPMGLVFSAWGGTRVEAWMSTNAINSAAHAVVPGKVIAPKTEPAQNAQSALYNAMVAPFDPLSVRAALWYQGEANCNNLPPEAVAAGANRSTYYSQYLQAMIADWRQRKKMGDFAFLVMGLPPSVAHTSAVAGSDATGRPQVGGCVRVYIHTSAYSSTAMARKYIHVYNMQGFLPRCVPFWLFCFLLSPPTWEPQLVMMPTCPATRARTITCLLYTSPSPRDRG